MSNNDQMTRLKQSPMPTDDEDDNEPCTERPLFNPQLSVEQGEIRYVTMSEISGLGFYSFIPQEDITSQVHFFSNIEEGSPGSLAGLKDGDRILQINGVNVTNLEHEDVRKLMQLITPIVMTVANDKKYLTLLQQSVDDNEENSSELPIEQTETKSRSSIHTLEPLSITSEGSTKSRRYEIVFLTQPDESSDDEPLKAKICHLRKSKFYDGFGLVLKYQKQLHIIGAVEEASPSYRAGLRENDVIIYVGKQNVEKLKHDEIKIMIRATVLATNHVDLLVLSRSDIPRYKILQERGLIDWSIINSDK